MKWTNSSIEIEANLDEISTNLMKIDGGYSCLLSYGCIVLQLIVLSASGFSLLRFMSRYRATIHDTLYGFAHFTLVFIMCLKASMIIFSKYSITFRVFMSFIIFGALLVFLLYLVYRTSTKFNFYGDLEEGSLHLAAMSGDNQKIKDLLRFGMSPDILGGDLWEGYPPIFPAIHQGIVNTVELLLDKGADINWQFKQGTCPIHFTIRMYHLLKEENLFNVFDLLISRDDIDLNKEALAKDVHASIPPRWSYHLDEVRRGKKQRLYSGSPLALAVRLGCGKMAEKLIKKGARVDNIFIDFENDFKFEWESFYSMKLLYYSGFSGFPRQVNLIKNPNSGSEKDEQFFELFKSWLQSQIVSPMSLKEISRIQILKQTISLPNVSELRQFCLPKELESYILFEDILSVDHLDE